MNTDGIVRIEKLGINNYTTWKRQAKFYLRSKRLWSVVKPTEEGTTSKSMSSAAAEKSDEALGVLGMLVEKHLAREIEECETAQEAWLKLEAKYEGKDTSRLLLLRQELTSLQLKPSEAVSVYLERAKDLMANLTAAGSTVSEVEVVLSVLAGLPEQYAMAVEVLQMYDDLSFQKTLTKLLQVEQRIQQKPLKDKQGVVQAFGAVQRKCFYCNQLGHIKAHCNKRKADVQKNGMVTTVAF